MGAVRNLPEAGADAVLQALEADGRRGKMPRSSADAAAAAATRTHRGIG